MSDTNPTGPDSSPPTTRLVYIAGSGRCGSTLLDILLGADPSIQSTGELMRILGGAQGHAQSCSCGEDIRTCPFWTRVVAEVGGTTALQQMDRGTRLEGTKGLFLGRLGDGRTGSLARTHAARLARLVRAVSQVSGRPIVVDSSKSLGRGYLYRLEEGDGLEVRYIHMVRDGRAFLWSKRARPDGEGVGKKTPSRSPLRLAGLWLTTNFVASIVFKAQSGRYLRVRYEDLTEHPTETLDRIGRFIGVDLSRVAQDLAANRPIPISHVVGGNRLRFSRGLVLKADAEWEQALPRRERMAFWAVAGWLAWWYGYASARRDSRVVRPSAPGP